jgi:hypothetical protein
LYGCHFANGYNINTLRMSWFYITFREHIWSISLGVRVYLMSTTVTYLCA